MTTEVVDPARLGIARSSAGDLRGGDAPFNAAAVRDLLAGQPGPVRDAVLLNAAAALVALEADGEPLEERLAAGLVTAAASVDSGAASGVLDRWVAVTQSF